jgi:hypothetical protein
MEGDYATHRCVLHFGNAPIHNETVVRNKLEEENRNRMPDPVYNPEILPFNFFLFSYPKDQLIDKYYATPEEPFCEAEATISGSPSDLISRAIQTWQKKVQKCWEMRRRYIE